MKKINYSLIISDFDGTLVNNDRTIKQSNKDAIKEYIANGGKFAISTGRLPAGIIARAEELGLKGVVSCCQGAVIVDIESKEVLLKGTISHEVTLKVCEKLESMGVHYHVYDLWDFYSNIDDEPLKMYERLTGTKGIILRDKMLPEFVRENKLEAYKFLVMVAPEDNAKIFKILEAENFEGCTITKSGDVLVEIINKNYSKGTTVEFLSKYYNIPIEKIVGIGDQWNDIPMIEKSGLGIAVKNADALLKEAADVTFDYTNEEGAVGKIIEKYGYSEE